MIGYLWNKVSGRIGALVVASLIPLAAFAGLVLIDQVLPAAGEVDSRIGFRWLMAVLALLLPACHGFLWATSTVFLGDKAARHPLGWRLSVPLSWRAVRSMWVTIGWLFLVVLIVLGVGMFASLLAFKDPGALVASTAQQASEYGEGTRIAPEKGQGGQSVRLEDFRQGPLYTGIALCALGGLWILLKALMTIPLRILGHPINILTALDSTGGWASVRLTLWIALVGVAIFAVHWALGLLLPTTALLAVDALLFVGLFWTLGGMLAWHGQKFAG